MEKIFNKLVRDNIPDIIASNKEIAITKILTDDEYKIELLKKLKEENQVFNCHLYKDVDGIYIDDKKQIENTKNIPCFLHRGIYE